jgi:hypothetical protein
MTPRGQRQAARVRRQRARRAVRRAIAITNGATGPARITIGWRPPRSWLVNRSWIA